MERLLILASELESEEVLGKGSFGEVHKSRYRGEYVAVKTLNEIDKESLERFQSEILLMAGLHHTNVVQLVGACWEKDLMALVMEYCSKGMSSEVVNNEGGNFMWDDPLLKWCMDAARAMRYLHAVTYTDVKSNTRVEGIMHRDLKPDNCLVSETYSVKVADFGEARAFSEDETMTQVGTPLFIAPEIVKGDNYGVSADLFSYSLTVLTWGLKGKESLPQFLFRSLMSDTGRSVNGINPKQSVGRVSHALISKVWRPGRGALEEQGIPRSLIGLILQCWEEDPASRPAFTDVFDYLETDAWTEVMPESSTKRKSTSGSLRAKILAQKKREEAEVHEKFASRKESVEELAEIVERQRAEISILKDKLDGREEDEARVATRVVREGGEKEGVTEGVTKGSARHSVPGEVNTE